MNRRRFWQLGVADPLSLIILGFITVSFILGATQVVKSGNSQFDTRSKAAGTKGDWESCTSSSQCQSGNCGKDPGDNTMACLPSTNTTKPATYTTPANTTKPATYTTPAQTAPTTGGTPTNSASPTNSGGTSGGTSQPPPALPPRPEGPAEGQTDYEPHNECGPVGEVNGLFCASGLRRIGITFTYKNGSWAGTSADCRFDTACGGSSATTSQSQPPRSDPTRGHACSTGEVCSQSCGSGTVVSQGCGVTRDYYCCRLPELGGGETRQSTHDVSNSTTQQPSTQNELSHDVARITPSPSTNNRLQSRIVTTVPTGQSSSGTGATSLLNDRSRTTQSNPVLDANRDVARIQVSIESKNSLTDAFQSVANSVFAQLPNSLTQGMRIHLTETGHSGSPTASTNQSGDVSICLSCDRSIVHDASGAVNQDSLKKQIETKIVPQLILNQPVASMKAGIEAFIKSGLVEVEDTGLVVKVGKSISSLVPTGVTTAGATANLSESTSQAVSQAVQQAITKGATSQSGSTGTTGGLGTAGGSNAALAQQVGQATAQAVAAVVNASRGTSAGSSATSVGNNGSTSGTGNLSQQVAQAAATAATQALTNATQSGSAGSGGTSSAANAALIQQVSQAAATAATQAIVNSNQATGVSNATTGSLSQALPNFYASLCAQYYTDPVGLKTANRALYDSCRSGAAVNN